MGIGKLFLLLALIAFIIFVVGIVNPNKVIFWAKNKTKNQAFWYLLVCIIFGVVAVYIHLHK
jgi:uncharacterized membrane protein YqhA